MSYAIMRAKKLKTFGNVAASLQHCFRERETPNADEQLSHHNQHFAARSTDEAMGKLRRRLPEKRRKDAVLAVEYVMTASPQWWQAASPEQQREFFRRALSWLSDKYGQENIFAATVHQDETSPHLSAFVVPLTADGRLSAKEFIGDRRQMSADQTSFARAVADLGLERGIVGSRAKHQSIRDYYAAIARAEQATAAVSVPPEAVKPKILSKGIFSRQEETPEMVAERITVSIREQIQEIAIAAAQSVQNGRQIENLRVGIKNRQTQSERILEALAAISPNQRLQVEEMAVKFEQENRAAKHRELRDRRQGKTTTKRQSGR